jgi:hypothetical protein
MGAFMKLKYYLRGIGVGILFSTILLSVTFRVSSEKELSDEEIIKRATTLGMVMKNDDNFNLNDLLEPTITPTEVITATPTPEPTLNPDDNTSSTTDNTSSTTDITSNTTDNTSSTTDNTTVEPTTEPTTEPTNIPDKINEDTNNNQNSELKYITVQILNGMSSENVATLLKNSGVITDDKAFNQFMRESGYTRKINVGEYQIPVNSTFDQIADVIVER